MSRFLIKDPTQPKAGRGQRIEVQSERERKKGCGKKNGASYSGAS